MATVRNISSHPVDLTGGLTLAPQGQGAANPATAHEADLIANGLLIVVDGSTPAPPNPSVQVPTFIGGVQPDPPDYLWIETDVSGATVALHDRHGPVVSAGSAAPAVDPFDDGYDIIVGMGQSNIMGQDTAIDTAKYDPSHPRVYMFPSSGADFDKVIVGLDPLAHLTGNGGVGPLMAFGRWYADMIATGSRRVLLVPCGLGGTGFETGWRINYTPSGSNLYEKSITQAQAALAAAQALAPNSRIAGYIWAQGEADSVSGDAPAYQTNLDNLIDGLRSRVADVPFLVIGMRAAYIAANGSGAVTVNGVHVETPYRKLRTGFAYGYTGTGWDANTHYSAAGARINGRAAAEAFARAKLNVLGTAPVKPATVTLAQSLATIVATWDQSRGRVTDYVVQYKLSSDSSWTTLTRARSIDATATITGITRGQSYDVRVATVNEQGTSDYTSATLVTVLAPAQVTGLAAGTPASNAMPLSWTAVSGAVSYLVEYKTHASGTWLTAGTPAGTSLTVTGLVASTSYDFRVSAQTVAETGPASSTVTASTAAPALLLTDVGVSAARAYSIRKVNTSYAGSAIRVRRSSDNTEQDIGFVSGLLDTASLLTFAGAGSAYVKTWYDQSGNTRDITQTTTTTQPRIVNAGTLDVANALASLVFDGTDDILNGTSPGAAAAGAASLLEVSKPSGTALVCPVTEAGTNPSYQMLNFYQGNKFQIALNADDAASVLNDITGTAPDANTPATFNDQLRQFSMVDTGASVSGWHDGSILAGPKTYSRSGKTFAANTGFYVGGLKDHAFFAGSMCEVVVFYSALTTGQRQAGEVNQKAFYGTP